MARERIDLPIQNYGLFKQRSMLHNCAQFPTLSGNAEVQIATVPKARGMFGWIPEGSAIKQAEQCFGWTIFRTESQGDEQEIYIMRPSGEIYKPFAAYGKSQANGYGHFTSAEFVDKDALRWVALQFDNKAYKFWEELEGSNGDIAINNDGLDFEKSAEILEIFINGSLFESYLSLRDIAKLSPSLYITIAGSGSILGPANIDGTQSPFFNATASAIGEYADSMAEGLNNLIELSSSHIAGVILSEQQKKAFTDYAEDGNGMDNRRYLEMYRNFRFFSSNPYATSTVNHNSGTYNVIMAIFKDNPYYAQWNGNWPDGQDASAVITQNDIDRSISEFKPAFQEMANKSIAVLNHITNDNAIETKIPNDIWIPFKTAFESFKSVMDGVAWLVAYDYGRSPYIFYAGSSSFMDGFPQPNITDQYGNNITWQPINFNEWFNYVNRYKQYYDNDYNVVIRQFWNSFIYSGNYETIGNMLKSRIEELKDLTAEIEAGDFSGKDAAISNLNHLIDVAEMCRESATYYLPHFFENMQKPDEYTAYTMMTSLSGAAGWFNRLSELSSSLSIADELRDFLLANKSDHSIIWIEQMSHMLFAVASDNRFYYSNPGDTVFESLNFYNAEYSNSKVYECWRLANRLVFFTSNTVEFWDLTNNFEDPVSPAYSSDVYSIEALRNSIVRFNDALYFIGKPIEMDAYSVFSLGKNGQLANLSYPQLETWINRQLFAGDVIGSTVNIENIPFIMWHLKNDSENLCYNITFNSFFWNDDLFFLVDGNYWQYDGKDIGKLDRFYDGNGYSVPCRIATTNTNFGGRQKRIVALDADVDLEEEKRDRNEERFIAFKFDRVSKMPWTSMRKVRLQPMQGSRNVCFKVFGLGLGADFQAEISWNGYLRINRLSLETE